MAPIEPSRGLSLLVIDGGGVKGLSALYLLEQLMSLVNAEAKNESPLKPCEYFDMIGGTSTGGIIAVMLGRLRMSVRDCIDAYLRMSDSVFKKDITIPFDGSGSRRATSGKDSQQTKLSASYHSGRGAPP